MTARNLYAEPAANHRRSWTLAAIGLAFVFIIGGAILGTIPGRLLGLAQPGDGITTWQENVSTLFGMFGTSTLFLIAWVMLFERRGLASLGLNKRGLARFGRGYAAGLGFVIATIGGIALLGGYELAGPGSLSVATLIPVAWLMAGFIIQGSSEELLFRGWLMGLIASRHGVFWAVLVNSALFSLAHAPNLEPSLALAYGLANILLIAIFLSLYAVREGSIWGVCGWHAAWNWLLLSGFGVSVSGEEPNVTPFLVDLADKADAPVWLTGGAFGPEASLVTTGVLLVGTVVMLRRPRDL